MISLSRRTLIVVDRVFPMHENAARTAAQISVVVPGTFVPVDRWHQHFLWEAFAGLCVHNGDGPSVLVDHQ